MVAFRSISAISSVDPVEMERITTNDRNARRRCRNDKAPGIDTAGEAGIDISRIVRRKAQCVTAPGTLRKGRGPCARAAPASPRRRAWSRSIQARPRRGATDPRPRRGSQRAICLRHDARRGHRFHQSLPHPLGLMGSPMAWPRPCAPVRARAQQRSVSSWSKAPHQRLGRPRLRATSLGHCRARRTVQRMHRDQNHDANAACRRTIAKAAG